MVLLLLVLALLVLRPSYFFDVFKVFCLVFLPGSVWRPQLCFKRFLWCSVMFGFGAFRELSVVCRSLDGLNVGVICLSEWSLNVSSLGCLVGVYVCC